MNTTVETIEMTAKIQDLLNEVLPEKAFRNVEIGDKPIGPGKFVKIQIAASSHEINGVRGQYVQVVSLWLDLNELELRPQVYGGSGGRRIYRKPNPELDNEKYLAMKGEDLPFRTPKAEEGKVLEAIRKFAIQWLIALQSNKDVLMHSDLVNYEELLEEFDMFEHYELLPKNVREIIVDFVDDESDRYAECSRIISKLEAIGWTADYDLSGSMYDLKKVFTYK